MLVKGTGLFLKSTFGGVRFSKPFFNFQKVFFSAFHEDIYTMSGESPAGLRLGQVVEELNKFADHSLAESWDNVGLLIEPYSKTTVKNILLTNDLTEAVMQESIDKKINLIISYHPPIFSPLKRITNGTWKERIVSACLENRIAVYSPHTSWDAVYGGVNDWLADSFADHIQPNGKLPLVYSSLNNSQYITHVVGPSVSINNILSDFKVVLLSDRIKAKENVHMEMCTVMCTKDTLKNIKAIPDLSIGAIKCEEDKRECVGMGRMLQLDSLTIEECVELIKKQTGLPFVRLALAKDKSKTSVVKTIALCAGSGGSLLKNVKADLFVTGEMFHHDLLEANHKGTSVILTNHSDSERGFLTKMEKILNRTFQNNVNISISALDTDPIKTV